MPNYDLTKKISAILFLYNEPINIQKLKTFLGDEELPEEIILEAIKDLEISLSKIGLVIIKNESKNENKSEYSIAVNSDLNEIAKKIRADELEGELTPASLQVLTICAYLGSSTKSEISFIRGIQSSQSIRSLSVRGLLKREGEKYTLSTEALQMLGLTKIEDLPEYEKIKTDFSERLKEVLETEKEETSSNLK